MNFIIFILFGLVSCNNIPIRLWNADIPKIVNCNFIKLIPSFSSGECVYVHGQLECVSISKIELSGKHTAICTRPNEFCKYYFIYEYSGICHNKKCHGAIYTGDDIKCRNM
jgi:hypothetical protein